MLNAIEGVTCVEPARRLLLLPERHGAAGPERSAGSVPATSAELAEIAIDEVKVAVVPGEAFGSPGYFRLSYALGDDDLVEGVARLQALFAEAELSPGLETLGTSRPPEGAPRRVTSTRHREDRPARARPAGRRRPRGRRPARPEPEQLLEAVKGAHALIIRSATTVTAEVLEAGTTSIVVGRAGIGLDNVDVAKATELGVMVVNAPQSNILSAAEQAMALLLAQARNTPQAHAALVAGQVGALEVGGRRAPRQDPRRRRPGPDRRARRPAGPRLRHAARRPTTPSSPLSGPGPWGSSW